MTTDVRQRLRNANPASGTGRVAPDALLRRLLAEPRIPSRRLRRSGLRRPTLLLAAAVLLLGGTAAGVSRFAVDYFGSDDSAPTPAAIVAELERLAGDAGGGDFGTIDAESFVRLAAFDTPEGRVTVYIAPTRSGDGYCTAESIGSELGGGGCGPTTVPGQRIPHGSSWNSAFGDVHLVYGRLMTGTETIDVRFQDGSVRPASVRAPWWIYVVGGGETEPGHAPVELIARGADGAIVVTQELNPYDFMNKEVIEAAIPESDGSPGQDGIRATLLGLGSFGAQIGSQVQLDRTYLVRTVRTSRGPFDVYAAPWGDGGICFGYADRGLNVEQPISGCPSGALLPDQPANFDSDEIQAVAVPAGFAVVSGPAPAGGARIAVRFEDGTSADADLSTPSFFIFWLEPEQVVAGRRPTELVAWDAQGRVLDTFELDPATLTP